MRGGQLADRVAEQVVGGDTPALEEPEQRHLDGEQPHLREPGVVDPLVGEHVEQRPVEARVDRVEHLGVHGETGVQVEAHAGVLGALTGEEHGEPAGARGAADQRGRGGAPPQRVQALGGRGRAGGQDDGAVLERGAGAGERPADVGRVEVRAGPQQGGEAFGLAGEGLGGTPGQHPRRERGRDNRRPHLGLDRCGGCGLVVIGVRGCSGRGRQRCVLDDDVRVGAADAERRDTDPARVLAPLPAAGLGEQFDGARGPVHVRGRRVDVKGGRQGVVAHRHDHLDDAGDARGRLGVADVRLDRAEPQRFGVLAPPAVRRQQCLRLDRVTEAGAGAVGLHDVHLGRGEPGVAERLQDHALLRRAVRGGEAVRRSVLVDGAAADHGEDLVAEALGVGESLDEQHADALGPAGAVGRRGERLAAPVGRQTALLVELTEDGGAGHDGDAAGERHRALARAQRLRGEVQRDQRRGAGGVDGDGGALEAECVRDPPRHDAGRVAGEQVTVGALGELGDAVAVPGRGAADEHPDLASAQRLGVDPGGLDGFPARLQQQPLLGVHGERLTWGDAEQPGVEVAGAVHEAALTCVLGVVRFGEFPATVGGERTDAVTAVGHQPPQVLGRAHTAGVPAAHADDGDGLASPVLGQSQTAPGVSEIGRDALEVFEVPLFICHSRSPCLGNRNGSHHRVEAPSRTVPPRPRAGWNGPREP
ncbi:hypothetical protein GCM10010435_24060 [Winogradskya consettensis]